MGCGVNFWSDLLNTPKTLPEVFQHLIQNTKRLTMGSCFLWQWGNVSAVFFFLFGDAAEGIVFIKFNNEDVAVDNLIMGENPVFRFCCHVEPFVVFKQCF